ncbi:MAG: hypothetical protein ACXWLM_05635, partial [Myxococcales bacterium]
AVGPLEIGAVNYRLRILGALSDVAATIVIACQQLGEPVVKAAIAQVAKEDLALRDLSEKQLVAVVGRVLEKAAGEIDPASLKAFLRTLLQGIWNSFDPEEIFCGAVKPKIFGIPLTPGDGLVSVQGWGNKLGGGCKFSFQPSYLLGYVCAPLATLLAASEQATFGYSIQYPDPFELLDQCPEAFSLHPDGIASFLKKGFQYFLDNAVFQVTYEISPLGLKMLGCLMRVTMPDLTHPPSKRGWKPPEERGDKKLPSRMELLSQALKQDCLTNLMWTGTAADLAQLQFDGGKSAAGLTMPADYFPHGGLIGAGRLALPKLLAETPPLDLLGTIMDGHKKPMDRAQAALKFLMEYVMAPPEEIGTLTFYIPGPNPPGDVADNPEELLRAICSVKFPDGKQPVSEVIDSMKYFFFRGRVHGRILGLELGEAEVDIVPSDGKSEAYLRVLAHMSSKGVLQQLIEGDAALEIHLREKPPEPIEKRFNKLSTQLQHQLQHGKHDEKALQKMVNELTHALEVDMPKAGCEARVKLRVPEALRPFLDVAGEAHFYAYSPRYAKEDGPTPVEHARYAGGAAFSGKYKMKLGGFSVQEELQLALETDQADPRGVPRLHGTWQASEGVDAGDGVAVDGIHGTIDSKPPAGSPLATLQAGFKLPALQIGPFTWQNIKVGEALKLDAPVSVSFTFEVYDRGRFHGHLEATASWKDLQLHAPTIELTAQPKSPKELIKLVRAALKSAFHDDIAKRLWQEMQNALQHEAGQALHDLQNAAGQVAAGAGDALERGKQELRAAADRARQDLRAAGDQAKQQVQGAADQAKRDLQDAADSVKHALEDAANNAVLDVQYTWQHVIYDVKSHLPHC